MQAAIAAAVLWIAVSGELGDRGGAEPIGHDDWFDSLSRQPGTGNAGLDLVKIYTVAFGSFALSIFGSFGGRRRIPIRDARPMPALLRFSYVLFVLAFAVVGAALVLQVPECACRGWWRGRLLLCWAGCFLGDAFYFLLCPCRQRLARGALAWCLRPTLEFSGLRFGPAWPFSLPLADDCPQYRVSLIVYIIILLSIVPSWPSIIC